MASDLNMSHGKMSDFVLFPLLRFFLVIRLTNFNLSLKVIETLWSVLIKKKKDVRFQYVLSNSVNMSCLRCFYETLVIS